MTFATLHALHACFIFIIFIIFIIIIIALNQMRHLISCQDSQLIISEHHLFEFPGCLKGSFFFWGGGGRKSKTIPENFPSIPPRKLIQWEILPWRIRMPVIFTYIDPIWNQLNVEDMDLLEWCLEKVPNIFPQMVVQNGDLPWYKLNKQS